MFIEGLYEEFDATHSFGYHSKGVVVVFTGKMPQEDWEKIRWHGQTHYVFSKRGMQKNEKFIVGCKRKTYICKNKSWQGKHVRQGITGLFHLSGEKSFYRQQGRRQKVFEKIQGIRHLVLAGCGLH